MSRRASAIEMSSGTPFPSPISYWNLDTDSLDQVGSNNGTDTAMSYIAGGIVGNCGDWNGTTSKIRITADSTLSFGNGTIDTPFTYSFWFNLDVDATSRLISKRYNTSGDFEYDIWYQQSTNEIFVAFYSLGSNVNLIRCQATLVPSVSTWYNVVVTYDGASGIKIYIDGVDLGGAVSTVGTYVAMSELAVDLLFGKLRIGGTTNTLNGKMDEIYLWDVELTPSEALFVYDEGLAGNTLI